MIAMMIFIWFIGCVFTAGLASEVTLKNDRFWKDVLSGMILLGFWPLVFGCLVGEHFKDTQNADLRTRRCEPSSK